LLVPYSLYCYRVELTAVFVSSGSYADVQQGASEDGTTFLEGTVDIPPSTNSPSDPHFSHQKAKK
jgi:hypothetical protein